MKKLLIIFALIMPISLHGSPIKPPKHHQKESLEYRLSRTLLSAAKPIIVARKKEIEVNEEPIKEVLFETTQYRAHSRQKMSNKVSHDIVNTNSIVSPYLGTVTVYLETYEPEHEIYDTLEEARHPHYKDPDITEKTFVFAYQHGNWVYKR